MNIPRGQVQAPSVPPGTLGLTSIVAVIDQVQAPSVPPGTLGNVPLVPRHGTLLREQNDLKVYLVKKSPLAGNQLCWVTSPAVFDSLCLSRGNVREVPDGSLAALPKGPNL